MERRAHLAGLVLVALAACSHDGARSGAASDAGPAPAPPATADVDTPADASEESPTAAAGPKHYRVVVHTGDSMVGGGLCKALAPMFEAEGTKFVRDVWEAASIPMFDGSDRIPELMKRYDPDLVLITLGANDIFTKHPEVFAKHIEGIVRKVGNRDCYWIGPPTWKGDNGLIAMMRDHASPCRFFDSSSLVLARRPDGIHPTEKGGEVWAEAFWEFMKGGEGG